MVRQQAVREECIKACHCVCVLKKKTVLVCVYSQMHREKKNKKNSSFDEWKKDVVQTGS